MLPRIKSYVLLPDLDLYQGLSPRLDPDIVRQWPFYRAQNPFSTALFGIDMLWLKIIGEMQMSLLELACPS